MDLKKELNALKGEYLKKSNSRQKLINELEKIDKEMLRIEGAYNFIETAIKVEEEKDNGNKKDINEVNKAKG